MKQITISLDTIPFKVLEALAKTEKVDNSEIITRLLTGEMSIEFESEK
jgi:hypothetical protein